QEAAVQAGARAAWLVEEPMAAAIGAGLPVHEPTGHLVVDVGGGTTEVACISLGGIVAAKAIRVAGFDMDAGIAAYVGREHAVVIGERTAEQVKLTVGSAWPQPGETGTEVTGRELATGLPRTVPVGAAEVREALREPVGQIVQAVLTTLAEVPPELSDDGLDKGIYLTGGAPRGACRASPRAGHLPARRGQPGAPAAGPGPPRSPGGRAPGRGPAGLR